LSYFAEFFVVLVYHVSLEATEWLKSTSDQSQDGGRRPGWKWLNRNNSAAKLQKQKCITCMNIQRTIFSGYTLLYSKELGMVIVRCAKHK